MDRDHIESHEHCFDPNPKQNSRVKIFTLHCKSCSHFEKLMWLFPNCPPSLGERRLALWWFLEKKQCCWVFRKVLYIIHINIPDYQHLTPNQSISMNSTTSWGNIRIVPFRTGRALTCVNVVRIIYQFNHHCESLCACSHFSLTRACVGLLCACFKQGQQLAEVQNLFSH